MKSTQLLRAFRLARCHGHQWAERKTILRCLTGSAGEEARARAARERELEIALSQGEATKLEHEEACSERAAAILAALSEEAVDLAALEEAVSQDSCTSLGICVFRDSDGAVRHKTGTGRVRWEIQRDGTTRVEIWRPGRCVIAAYLAASATRAVVVAEWSDCEERHWDAILDCLIVLEVDEAQLQDLRRESRRDLAERADEKDQYNTPGRLVYSDGPPVYSKPRVRGLTSPAGHA